MQLTIQFLQQDHQLVCVVEDNGIGIDVSLKRENRNEAEIIQLELTM
jgi:glucose-6-phosphate-specific signal transduction histidine kinase